MTGLLVSVRDRGEALDALFAGANIIDLKEPARGALGSVSLSVMREVVRAVEGRTLVTAALGELSDVTTEVARDVPSGIALAKLGLAGCSQRRDWQARFELFVATLPESAGSVAVIYADSRLAAAPSAEQVLDLAEHCQCRAVLVDTWSKSEGGLLDLWTITQCRRVIDRARSASMLAVLAGSLTSADIERLLPLAPDYVAVRGAACAGSREGRLDPRRVEELAALVRKGSTNSDKACELAPTAKPPAR